MLGSLKDSTC